MNESQTDALLRGARESIDQVDQALIELLLKRKQLVEQVAEIKSIHGLPVYLPDREKKLIKQRRAEAKAKGVSPDLVEDLLRRIISQSYHSESKVGFQATRKDPAPILIIGGGGGMGRLFSQLLQCSGYKIRILEQDDWHEVDALVKGVSMVLISVPIASTQQVIQQLAGKLPKTCLLADLTSVKTESLATMLKVHKGPVLGLHPMFGPSTQTLAKQVIICCHGRQQKQYDWFLKQMEIWGATLFKAQAKDHDEIMAVVQALRHFSTFAYGALLKSENIDLQQVLNFSSPIYRLELMMVGRLFAQDAPLYADIIFSSKHGPQLAQQYLACLTEALTLWQNKDKQAFIEHFNAIKTWFGQDAKRFLKESNAMIEHAIVRQQ